MMAEMIDPSPLSPIDIAAEMERVERSFPYFLAKYVWIKDEQLFTTFKLEPWEWQLRAAADVTDLAHRFHIILKSRQEGASWVIGGAQACWTILRPNANVIMISYRQDEARELLSKARFIYGRLPEWMRPPLVKDNEGEFEVGHTWSVQLKRFEETSAVTALPSTKDAGVGKTVSLLVLDEFAMHPHADENWAALWATVERAGRVNIISTARGTGNTFSDLYWSATRDENEFRHYFWPYHLRPGRDAEWWDKGLAQARDKRRWYQDYPRAAIEAFSASGGCIFDLERLEVLEKVAREMTPLKIPETYARLQEVAKGGAIEIFELPSPIEHYVAGTDVAKGYSSGDYSSTTVLNARSRKVAAVLHGHYDPEDFTAKCVDLLRLYRYPLWGVEVTGGYGDIVLVGALRLGYPRDRIYHYKPMTGDKKTRARRTPGWPTNARTKPMMEARLQGALKSGDLICYSLSTIQELKTYVEDPDTHKTGAQGNNHDDRAISLMIANALLFEEGATPAARGERAEPDFSQRAAVRTRRPSSLPVPVVAPQRGRG